MCNARNKFDSSWKASHKNVWNAEPCSQYGDRSQFCSWGPQGFLATMSQINGVDKQGSLFNFLLSVFENISNITMFIS